jgi:hypothetical protein
MKFGLVAFGAACAFAAAQPGIAGAVTPSAVVTVTSTTLVFNATNMTNTALAASPTTASASVTFTTTSGGAGGTITVVPGTLTGSSGGVTLAATDFTLTCKKVSGSGFTAAPAAQLNGATTCGTLAAGKNNVTATFSIALTLNHTLTAATPFDATTYLGTFTVSATAS